MPNTAAMSAGRVRFWTWAKKYTLCALLAYFVLLSIAIVTPAQASKPSQTPLAASSQIYTFMMMGDLGDPVKLDAPVKRRNYDRYSRSGTTTFANRGVCISWKVTGLYKYTAIRARLHGDQEDLYWLENVRLVKPRMTLTARAYDSVKHWCTPQRRSWDKLIASQSWAGYKCDFNPSISVGAPWGVSASFWPQCGQKKKATNRSGYGKGWYREQENDGTVIRWQGHTYGSKPTNLPPPRKGPCYGSLVDMHVYHWSGDNRNNSGRIKTCLTPKFR